MKQVSPQLDYRITTACKQAWVCSPEIHNTMRYKVSVTLHHVGFKTTTMQQQSMSYPWEHRYYSETQKWSLNLVLYCRKVSAQRVLLSKDSRTLGWDLQCWTGLIGRIYIFRLHSYFFPCSLSLVVLGQGQGVGLLSLCVENKSQ